MTANVETVHTIFKTHLDLGFTSLARNVVRKYVDDYLPRAIDTAETLRRSGRKERFIWTTGAWLIYHYLETAAAAERKRMEAAIEAGDITWHALPFTVHSELMDASLCGYGLRFAQALDRRFGRRTIAAKMTDVPGHTRGIVPLLADAGIQFLHIGVNEASTMPDVPPLFVWRDNDHSGDSAELIVMYQHTYGASMVVPGLSEAIAFAHTLDNLGPQTADEVVAVFAELRQMFPQAEARASTLDAFAQALLRIKPQLPVITQEIGDTWIHGVGSDPKKVSQFRELCRLRNRWLSEPGSGRYQQMLDDFSEQLLLVAEHTWGMDVKVHLGDATNYTRELFDAARAQRNFQRIASSWAEQRAYLDQAVAALEGSPLAPEARARLQVIEPAHPDEDGFEPVGDLSRPFETSHFSLRFDASSGAINYLLDRESGQTWATAGHLLGRFRYQTFSQADYDRFLDSYLVRRPPWAEADFAKPGLDGGGGESRWWQPTLSRLLRCEDEEGSCRDRFLLKMTLPEPCNQLYGGPRQIILTVDAPRGKRTLTFDLQWFEKPANRQPEAFWFSFCPQTAVPTAWSLEKLGSRISPLDVVPGGNRKLHAVGRGVFYNDGKHTLTIETLDAPLVAPGEPSLLNFNSQQPALGKGMHFNLYNNVWGTNFPQWCDEDARFRSEERRVGKEC